MRVLVFTDPSIVHSERFVECLAKKAEVALFWHGDKWNFKEAYHIPFYPPWKLMFWGIRWLRQIEINIAVIFTVLTFNPDVVHIHRSAEYCKRFKRFSRKLPVIYSAWGHLSQSILEGAWIRQISYADGLTGDSFPLIEELRRIPGCNNTKFTLFYFGLNEDAFKPALKSSSLINALGLPSDAKIVYSARSLRPQYNHETLVKAIPMILQKIPNVYFVFVDNHGHRYPDSADYAAKLKSELDDLGVLEQCRFLGHFQNRSDLAILFQTSDVVVSIPPLDSFPATIFEAMACGIPLVVSDLPDYDGVVDASNAIRINPCSADDLAKAVISLLTDHELYERIRSAGLHTVAEKGNMEREMDKLIEFYKELMESKK